MASSSRLNFERDLALLSEFWFEPPDKFGSYETEKAICGQVIKVADEILNQGQHKCEEDLIQLEGKISKSTFPNGCPVVAVFDYLKQANPLVSSPGELNQYREGWTAWCKVSDSRHFIKTVSFQINTFRDVGTKVLHLKKIIHFSVPHCSVEGMKIPLLNGDDNTLLADTELGNPRNTPLILVFSTDRNE